VLDHECHLRGLKLASPNLAENVVANEAHLRMIQDVVSRLAGQSTTIKGWAITVTGALLGYGVSQSKPALAIVAGYAILAFAALDGYYLALERAYRDLYQQAVAGTAEEWRLRIDRLGRQQLLAAAVSPAHLLLYGASVAIVTVIGGYLAASG
jgi:hypothetical protein